MSESQKESKRALVSSHCSRLDYDEKEIFRLIDLLDKRGSFDAPAGELSIAFVDREKICQLHEQFMEDSSPTDVITFPGDIDAGLAGEICTCPEVAQEYSSANGKDFAKELALYLVHGYLHLCGFDDRNEDDKMEMRNAENQALELIEKEGAFPTFSLREA